MHSSSHPNPDSPAPTSSPLTRRTLLKATTAGGIAAFTTGQLTSPTSRAYQIDVPTPPPAPLLGSAYGPTVESKAAELAYDQERIFRFVADEIRYEDYAGVLRGASGTLWSRAGNSVDQALLLAALYDEAAIAYEFASAALSPAQAEALAAQKAPDPDVLRSSYASAFAEGFTLRDPGTPSSGDTLSDEDQALLDEMAAAADQAFDTARELADAHLAIILDALSHARIDVPASPAVTLSDMETRRHVWLQVIDGPNRIDLDPSLPADAWEQEPLEATETFAEIPVDLYHALTLRLVAEEFYGGTTSRRDAVLVTTTSDIVVNEPIEVAVVPAAAFTGLGLTINEAVNGDVSLLPVIAAKWQFFPATTPVVFGSNGGLGASLGDEASLTGLADGETLAVWLVVDVQSPGAAPVSIERPLLDRIGFEQRASGSIDYAGIAPLPVVDPFGMGSSVPGLLTANVLSVESTRLPVSFALGAERTSAEADILPLIAPCMSAFRDGLRLATELDAGSTSYIATPQLSLTSLSLVDPDDPDSDAEVVIDMLRHENVTVSLDESSTRAGNALMLAGVLDHVAERLTLHPVPITDAGEIGQVSSPDAGEILASAGDQGIPIVAVATVSDLDSVQVSAEGKARIESHLGAGMVVVLPERPVEAGEEQVSGWWVIDPVTGSTRDETEHGRGYAARRMRALAMRLSPMTEEAETDEAAAKMQPWYRRLGKHLDCGYAVAAIALGVGGGALAVATGNTVGVAAAAVSLTKGIRDANKPFGGGGCR